MKLYFMKQDAVDFMKHNMDRLYTHYFQEETNEWMAKEYGSDPFSEFMDVPDFELAEIDAMTIGEVDFENCKIIYNNLRSLSESQCSEERLWAGLCNSVFYDYIRRRYQYPSTQLKNKEKDVSAVISRFFFSGGTRSGFYRNCLAKCWWVGRATFDKDNENHFARLDIIGSSDLTTKISDIFYSNTFTSNPTILAGICDGLKFFADRGQILDVKKHIRPAMRYLNAVGGAALLDVLTSEEISKLVISRIISIIKDQTSDFELDNDEEDQILEEMLEEDTVISENNALTQNDLDNLNQDQSIIVEDSMIDDLPRPDYITYGCWVLVLDEKSDKKIKYHIPLKDDHSRVWLEIEEKMMGQDVDFRFFFAGKNYRILDFGYDNTIGETPSEFNCD